jgi:hypothetical protein
MLLFLFHFLELFVVSSQQFSQSLNFCLQSVVFIDELLVHGFVQLGALAAHLRVVDLFLRRLPLHRHGMHALDFGVQSVYFPHESANRLFLFACSALSVSDLVGKVV